MTRPERKNLIEKIEAARDEFDRLRDAGEQAVADKDKDALVTVLMELGKLFFKIPVRDRNAEDVPEGIALSEAVSDLQASLDDQLGAMMEEPGLLGRIGRFFGGKSLRPAPQPPGAYKLYR